MIYPLCVCRTVCLLVVLACSAGIGRTGTYVCLDHSMHLLQTTNEVDCIQVVTNVRNDRCALVQVSWIVIRYVAYLFRDSNFSN